MARDTHAPLHTQQRPGPVRRRVLALVILTVAAGWALPFLHPNHVTAQAIPPDQAPPGRQAGPRLPDTPVGHQLGWVLDQLNGDAAALTEAEVNRRFAPEFLLWLPAAVVHRSMQQSAAERGPFTLLGFTAPPIDTQATAILQTATGERGMLVIAVEATPPHRITRLELGEAPPPPTTTGRRVDIGGRAIFLNCTGTGGPTVVLEGGLASDWAAVQGRLEPVTRVCSYDRPDTPGSSSDPVPAPRTAREVVTDLHAVLAAAGEPGPYVLAGHSMGGLYVQLYAYQHPDNIAGLVLVDPTPENYGVRLQALVAEIEGMPSSADGQAAASPPLPSELRVFEESFAQMRAARAAGTLRPMPLVVLTHGVPTPQPGVPDRQMVAAEELWLTMHGELAGLMPDGRHIIATGSGHDIHQERPELVSDAICAVVKMVAVAGGSTADCADGDGASSE